MAPNEQLTNVLALVRDILGPALVGAYLHGSAALGDLRPHSDLDILVVSGRQVARREKRGLIDRLLVISEPHGPGRPVGLTVVVHSEIRPWRYPPRMDFQYGDWLRPAFERGEIEPWPTTNPDLASLITMALLGNATLVGPPPGEVFDPVPPDDYIRAIVGDIDRLLLEDLDWDTRNVLLTLARIWSTVATHTIRAKMPPQHGHLLALHLSITRSWLMHALPIWANNPIAGQTSSTTSGRPPSTWSMKSGV